MREAIAHQILERLCNIEAAIEALAKHNTTKHAHTAKLLKEVKKTMASQADVDAIAANLDAIKTEVVKIGDDLAAFIANNPSVDVSTLAAKASEIATRLQSIDDVLPERT